jgi:orotate phosphoribosyltransferase
MERSVRHGTFTLASGRQSDFYVDGKQTTLHAEGATLVGQLVLERIRGKQGGVRAVGGLTLGADPIGTATSILSTLDGGPHIDAFIVRKSEKGHGTGVFIEGLQRLPAGSSVCVVEDTSTTGASAYRAIERVVAAGFSVAQVITIVDREEGASEFLAEKGYALEALVTRAELTPP